MTRRINMILLAATVLLVLAPMALKLPGKYEGADSQAEEAISATGYEPWFEPLWEPPSGEIESLLFAVQAALGAGVLGYVIGRLHNRGQSER